MHQTLKLSFIIVLFVTIKNKGTPKKDFSADAEPVLRPKMDFSKNSSPKIASKNVLVGPVQQIFTKGYLQARQLGHFTEHYYYKLI